MLGYPPIPVPGNEPNTAPTPSTNDASSSNSSPEKTTPPRPALKKQDSRASGNHSNTSVMNKTIEILLERQKEFKEAALEAKKSGEIEQAKEYLKSFKGIENLLDVARGGLPIDLTTVCNNIIRFSRYIFYNAQLIATHLIFSFLFHQNNVLHLMIHLLHLVTMKKQHFPKI